MELNQNSQTPDPHNPWWMPTFTPTVELADGTTMNGTAMLDNESDYLWIWLEMPVDLSTAFITFSNPQKTQKIISHTTSIETFTWENYTELSLIQSANNQVTIRMRKARV